MFWSDMTEVDKSDAEGIGLQFVKYYLNSDFEEIGAILYGNLVNVGGNRWLQRNALIEELRKSHKRISLQENGLNAYNFDEFLDNFIGNELILRSHEVFDNHSVLVKVVGRESGKPVDCLLVIRRDRSSSWGIIGIMGLTTAGKQIKKIDSHDFRIEKFPKEGIQMPVPNSFAGPEIIDNQSIFFYEGNSGRDAVIQVMSDQLQAKIHYYTFKFVEHSNQQFKMSDLTVRYLPSGIMYEYEVVDPSGVRNKGITVGVENNGKAVLVQVYALIEAFGKIEEKVYYSLENINQ